MRRFILAALGLALALPGLGLASITIPKLWKMAQIEGWAPGARHEVVRITEKWCSEPPAREECWVSWGLGDIHVPGNHRLNLRLNEWPAVKPGDPLEIIFAGSGRFRVYRRGGVFTEPGQFVFDGALLAGEALLVWYGLRLVIRAGWRRNEVAANDQARGSEWHS